MKVNKMAMKVYQNLGINKPEDANLPLGTLGIPFVVESAQIIKKGFSNKDVLQMGLKEKDKELGLSFGYGLIGPDIYEPFMDSAKVDKVESLVGKTVFAFISPKQDTVKGLTIR